MEIIKRTIHLQSREYQGDADITISDSCIVVMVKCHDNEGALIQRGVALGIWDGAIYTYVWKDGRKEPVVTYLGKTTTE